MIDLSRLMLVVLITAELIILSSLDLFSCHLSSIPEVMINTEVWVPSDYQYYNWVDSQLVDKAGVISTHGRWDAKWDHARIPFWEGCKTKQKSVSLTVSKPWPSEIPVGHLNLLSLEEPSGNWVHMACTLCTTRINSVECMRVCVCVWGGRGEEVGIKGKGGGLGRKETVAPFPFSLLYSPPLPLPWPAMT